MLEVTTAFEIAKNFPSGIGGFFGAIIGGLVTAYYLRKMLLGYLERTLNLEKKVEEHGVAIELIKDHLGI